MNSRSAVAAPPTTTLGRIGWGVQQAVERLIVRLSVHRDTPVYDTDDFPWVSTLEADWQRVRAEAVEVLRDRDRLPNFQEIVPEVATITSDDAWKTFYLTAVGMDCEQNARRCPETLRALAGIPDVTTAFFSILAPGKHIPAHRGPYNGVLRLHLGLVVPEPRESCRIRVADEIHAWQEGRVLIFDDTFNHEVWNDTDGWRVVLFVDFARPLRRPWHRLNRFAIGLTAFAPILREADRRQRRWAADHYRSG